MFRLYSITLSQPHSSVSRGFPVRHTHLWLFGIKRFDSLLFWHRYLSPRPPRILLPWNLRSPSALRESSQNLGASTISCSPLCAGLFLHAINRPPYIEVTLLRSPASRRVVSAWLYVDVDVHGLLHKPGERETFPPDLQRGNPGIKGQRSCKPDPTAT